MAMGLYHQHFDAEEKQPTIIKPWTYVSSNQIVISKDGKTPLVCDMSSCLGVIMCGKGKWGAVSHMHCNIQLKDVRLDLALYLAAKFVREQTKEDIIDVLLFFGESDGEANFGKLQGKDLSVAAVKALMNCKNVIDRRRPKGGKGDNVPWGRELVYDPSTKTVYTAVGPSIVETLDLKKHFELAKEKFQPFPFTAAERALNYHQLTNNMANRGYCVVP